MMVEQVVVGATYRMAADLSVSRWCVCETVLRRGDLVHVLAQRSPNRVEVRDATGGLHKVRRSTLRMCVEAYDGR